MVHAFVATFFACAFCMMAAVLSRRVERLRDALILEIVRNGEWYRQEDIERAAPVFLTLGIRPALGALVREGRLETSEFANYGEAPARWYRRPSWVRHGIKSTR